MSESADVVVIGMGPGGEDVAGRLAEAGLDVIGIDHELVGGECPYWGCVPSKMMVRAAHLIAETRRVDGVAGTAQVEPDWAPVARRIREEATDNWDDTVAVERFEGKGGRFIRAHGRIVGPGRVLAGDEEITAGKGIVVATGTHAAIPPIDGLADIAYWTNRDAIQTEEVPPSLIVLGGGAIGLELAQVFARFGSEVAVVEALDQLLPLEEPEVGELLAEVLAAEGIGVHTSAKATRVEMDGGQIRVALEDGTSLTAARLLVATGRRVDLGAVGLGSVGVDETARAAPTDGHLRVADGVWAVGDVTGKGAFTHVAMYQSRIAVADILGEPHIEAEYHAVPRVTFTDPEVGSVGLSEAQAVEDGISVRTGTARVPSSARGWLHKVGNEGLIKVVADTDRGVLVGATSAGPTGGEVLGFLALAVQERVPVARLRSMIYAYPTFHRGIEDTLTDLEAS